MSALLWVNGAPAQALRLASDDPSWTVGLSVFETVLVRDGQARSLRAHLARLVRSAALLALPPPPLAELRADIAAVLANSPPLARLRLTWTGAARFVSLAPLASTDRGRPRRVVGVAWPRCPLATAKHASRGPWVAAVRQSGADDVLLLDGDGAIREATMAAVFAVCDGALCTAPDDGAQLASIGLREVLGTAVGLGLPVVRERPCIDGRFEGLYLVSALRGIEPVVELDGRPLPGWEVVGRRLASLTG